MLRDCVHALGGHVMDREILDAQRECGIWRVRPRHVHARLDFRRRFIAEVDEPSAQERQRLRCSCWHRFRLTAEPRFEIVEKSAGDDVPVMCGQDAVRVAEQRRGRFAGKHAVARQRAARRAVEEHRVTRGVVRGERSQCRTRNRHRRDERERGSPRAWGNAPLLQPLKRRKISEPLVPPKPNEFDSAASIATLRAVFGT